MKIVKVILQLVTLICFIYEFNSSKARSTLKASFKSSFKAGVFGGIEKYKDKKNNQNQNKVNANANASKPATNNIAHNFNNVSQNSRFKATTSASNLSAASAANAKKAVASNQNQVHAHVQNTNTNTAKAKQFDSISSLSKGGLLDSQYDLSAMNKQTTQKKTLGAEQIVYEAWVKYYSFTSETDEHLLSLAGKKIPLYANTYFLKQKQDNPTADLTAKSGGSFVNIPNNSSFYMTLFPRMASISNSRVVSI